MYALEMALAIEGLDNFIIRHVQGVHVVEYGAKTSGNLVPAIAEEYYQHDCTLIQNSTALRVR